MNSKRVAKLSLTLAIVVLVVSVAGFVTTLALNAFVLDEYDAYGEVPIPGSGSVHLPAGDATVSLHTLVVGSGNGGLPVPPLKVSISGTDGAPNLELTENIGSTTTINSDAHVRVWDVHVPVAGTYNVVTGGQVNGYIDPRLAFGHNSAHGYLVWVFVGLFIFGLIDLTVSIFWLNRSRRRPVPLMERPSHGRAPAVSPFVSTIASPRPPASPSAGAGDRLERLKTLASLRDSGALTEVEFQQEKRRILDGI